MLLKFIAFCVSAFRYVQCNLLCHNNIIQQKKQAECIPCMDYTAISRMTNSWMKISYIYWYDHHTVFGMIISDMKFTPFMPTYLV